MLGTDHLNLDEFDEAFLSAGFGRIVKFIKTQLCKEGRFFFLRVLNSLGSSGAPSVVRLFFASFAS